jgi:hypothetical protein
MAASVIPCDSCGSPISDSDLESGAAITLLGRRYCTSCKTEAIQNVSLEELADKPAPRPAPSKAPPRPPVASASRAPVKPPEPPPAPARSEKKLVPKRATSAPTAPSRAPLLIGIAALVVVLVIVGGIVAFRGGPSAPPGHGSTDPGPSSKKTPAPPGQDRETQAAEAYAKVELLTRRAGVSVELILAAVEKARPACRGTEWEKRLEELRSKAAREKETEDAARDLSPLVDELKGAVATDPEFKRYAELQPKFQLALEMAGKTAAARMPEIRALQKEYNGRYERTAEPFYNEINEAATSLSEERRYDDALKRIDTFPQYLRHSGAWLSLEQLKKDIERRRKQLPPKK